MTSEVLLRFFTDISEFWSRNYRSVAAGRLRPLLNKLILFEVEGEGGLAVAFAEGSLEIMEDTGGRHDARVRMSRDDWLDVIAGRVGIMSVVVAGRCPYPKDQRLPISKASIVLQSIATMQGTGSK